MLANWLICVAHNSVTQDDRLTFTSDPNDGDGIIYDSVAKKAYPTEHVLVPRASPGQALDGEALILKKIELKRSKGRAYASGKTLVVFLNAGGGKWSPNKVAKQLSQAPVPTNRDPTLFEHRPWRPRIASCIPPTPCLHPPEYLQPSGYSRHCLNPARRPFRFALSVPPRATMLR
jgi:hypothetical protein